jgi:hypothetical protein
MYQNINKGQYLLKKGCMRTSCQFWICLSKCLMFTFIYKNTSWHVVSKLEPRGPTYPRSPAENHGTLWIARYRKIVPMINGQAFRTHQFHEFRSTKANLIQNVSKDVTWRVSDNSTGSRRIAILHYLYHNIFRREHIDLNLNLGLPSRRDVISRGRVDRMVPALDQAGLIQSALLALPLSDNVNTKTNNMLTR